MVHYFQKVTRHLLMHQRPWIEHIYCIFLFGKVIPGTCFAIGCCREKKNQLAFLEEKKSDLNIRWWVKTTYLRKLHYSRKTRVTKVDYIMFCFKSSAEWALCLFTIFLATPGLHLKFSWILHYWGSMERWASTPSKKVHLLSDHWCFQKVKHAFKSPRFKF